MSNAVVTAIAWIAAAAHLVVGIVAWRRLSGLPLVPLLNLATSACVLAYWAQKWYCYVTKGITWYVTDQLIPVYAIVVVVLAGVSLTGRYGGSLTNWLVFGVDAAVLLAGALFFAFFRITRLI